MTADLIYLFGWLAIGIAMDYRIRQNRRIYRFRPLPLDTGSSRLREQGRIGGVVAIDRDRGVTPVERSSH